MDTHLTAAFGWLKRLGAALCHYKVCSTFDSSPTVGSIGRAIEIGRRVFGEAPVPLVVGAPQLKRYTAFGHLFAGYQGRTFRIDRHPVMSRHPVTPMLESDLLLHLAGQTGLRLGLVDLAALGAGRAREAIDQLSRDGAGIILLRRGQPGDAGGSRRRSSGGCASRRLSSPARPASNMRSWQNGRLQDWRRGRRTTPAPVPVDRLAVVSGSVSPTTERQIGHALANGFDGIALDPLELVSERAEAVVEKAIAVAGCEPCRRAQRHPLHRARAAGRSRRRDRQPGGRAPQARPKPRRHPSRVW